MKQITLDFTGYHRNPLSMPSEGGIYCVYTGIRNPAKNTCTLTKLVYIGEADDLCSRFTRGHEHQEDFENELEGEEILYYSFALIGADVRERAESALIFHHAQQHELINSKCCASFSWPDTEIVTTGSQSNLASQFIVKNGENRK